MEKWKPSNTGGCTVCPQTFVHIMYMWIVDTDRFQMGD